MLSDVYADFCPGEKIALEIQIWKPLIRPYIISGVTGDGEKPCKAEKKVETV